MEKHAYFIAAEFQWQCIATYTFWPFWAKYLGREFTGAQEADSWEMKINAWFKVVISNNYICRCRLILLRVQYYDH